MTYRLIQLAPGSFDLLLDDVIIASVVQSLSRSPIVWTAELLDETPAARPAPFTKTEHDFTSFEELCSWLRSPEIKPNRREHSTL